MRYTKRKTYTNGHVIEEPRHARSPIYFWFQLLTDLVKQFFSKNILIFGFVVAVLNRRAKRFEHV